MSKAVSCTIKMKTEAQAQAQAEAIFGELQSRGFSNRNVSIFFPDRSDTKRWVQKSHADTGGLDHGGSNVRRGILDWLGGIGRLAIPGIGPFLAAGPMLTVFSGLKSSAALGDVTSALVGLGMPEYEAKIYDKKIKEGLIVISAHTEDAEVEKRSQARGVFLNAHADNVSESDEVDDRQDKDDN